MGGNRPLLKHKLVCLLCWRPYRFVHELRAHFDSHHAAWKKHHTDNLTHLNKTCIVCGKYWRDVGRDYIEVMVHMQECQATRHLAKKLVME